MRLGLFVLIAISGIPALAQTSAGTIQATGTASVSAKPDQAQISLSVVTDGATAQDAAQQNATLANSVIAALTNALGSSGTLETTGYSLYARYGSGVNAGVVGYTASNSIQVTTTDLTLVGKLIDTANQAGANNVGGLSFGLQNSDPIRQQALTLAAKQATTHAAAIASGLGSKAGAVISAQEVVASVVSANVPGVALSASTPVVTGTLSVSATVTVTVQLTQ